MNKSRVFIVWALVATVLAVVLAVVAVVLFVLLELKPVTVVTIDGPDDVVAIDETGKVFDGAEYFVKTDVPVHESCSVFVATDRKDALNFSDVEDVDGKKTDWTFKISLPSKPDKSIDEYFTSFYVTCDGVKTETLVLSAQNKSIQ
ncbi:hypothetical protein FACS1894125_4210 [Actinomycetota bacterium]|nr:hypothetical protein FACS1894125_4210 [Actinomycetota bacterium]